jgi:hypothetical protein
MARARRRIDYAEVELSTGEIINAVRKAFEGLVWDVRVKSKRGTYRTLEGATREIAAHRWEVAYAVHSIVCGLSRATAHPPAWFRLEGRPVGGKKGRPPATEGKFIAYICADHFTRITGRPASVQIDPETKRPYGAFYDLVVAVFETLAIPDSAQTCARQAQRHQRKEEKAASRSGFCPLVS